jgi:predicted N-formylglutamate amidohydrolase
MPKEPVGYSMEIHAERHGFPHALLEIRQNEISSVIGQSGGRVCCIPAFTDILADKKILTPLENDSGTNHPCKPSLRLGLRRSIS